MVHVETIDLSARGIILPNDHVGMVVAQPFLRLTHTEPFLCLPEAKEAQLGILSKTLEVSLAMHHGMEKAHFTVFPEYSICGLDGIYLIDTALQSSNWPTGTIVIGGTDALSKEEFNVLRSNPGTHACSNGNRFDQMNRDAWINCKITWVKGADGTVERWLQPKLAPALPEQNVTFQHMFCGECIFLFKGPFQNDTEYRFCSLVCFDWIAKLGDKMAWQWVLEHMQHQATELRAELPLSWFFVIQCNPKPSHDTFLLEVAPFFDQTAMPRVKRDRACLVFVNSAGNSVPGRAGEFGQTSLIFHPQVPFQNPTCHPTFSNGGPHFRSSTLLNGYHDILFRERGACIHSFAQVNPSSLVVGPGGRKIALQNASVYPLNGAVEARAPSAPVPACVKWLHDELDQLTGLSAQYPRIPLAAQSDETHRQTLQALRKISDKSATNTINLATQRPKPPGAPTEKKEINADEWDTAESASLRHLVHTLDIVTLGSAPPIAGTDPAHATVQLNNQPVDLIAIRGETHELCRSHSDKILPQYRRQTLLVTRDQDNTPYLSKFGSFLRTEKRRLGEEQKYTDPDGAWLHVGYQNLLQIFMEATTAAAISGGIDAELAA